MQRMRGTKSNVQVAWAPQTPKRTPMGSSSIFAHTIWPTTILRLDGLGYPFSPSARISWALFYAESAGQYICTPRLCGVKMFRF